MTDYIIASGETESGLVLQSGDTLDVEAGGSATSLSGEGNVTDLGLIKGGFLADGFQVVEDGGEIESFSVFGSGTFLEDLSGGTLSGLTVAGEAEVDNEGAATGLAVANGGYVLDAGGTDSGASIDSGGMIEAESGSMVSMVNVNQGGTLIIDSGETVTGISLAVGGTVDLDGSPYQGGDDASLDTSTDVLTIVQASGGPDVALQLSGSYTGDYFALGADAGGDLQVSVVSDGTPCYCTGTLILTDQGEVAVEDLHEGDRVVVRSGPPRAVRWMGRRSYPARFAARNHDVHPVLFRAGSLGDGLPRRDLRVSPLHAMFLDGVLVPAMALVNGASVLREAPVADIGYHHVELDSHDILLAEGTWSETFVDDGSRGMFHNASAWRRDNRDFVLVRSRYCAPRVESGEALESICRRIAAGVALSPVSFSGHLDAAGHSSISGWTPPAPDGSPSRVRLSSNGVTLAEVTAFQYRADLVRAGHGDGRHGFSFDIPGGLDPSCPHAVRAHRAHDGVELIGSPFQVDPTPLRRVG